MPLHIILRSRNRQVVYFLQLRSGAIKIGTSGELKRRINALRRLFGQDAVLLSTIPGGAAVEARIHEQFAHLRFPGTEQFRPSIELMEFIGMPLLATENPDAIQAQPETHEVRKTPRELVGQRFGRLTVLGEAERYRPNTRGSLRRWLCRCDCGAERVVFQNALTSGVTVSCGCYNKEAVIRAGTKHGGFRSPEYGPWNKMLDRCRNPNSNAYANYGGRGIRVCEKWLSFEGFLEDMGPRPTRRHQLDRIDVNGDYCKANCRWATPDLQMRNTRRNRLFTHEGMTLTLMDWAKIYGIHYNTLAARLNLGIPIEEALTMKKHSRWRSRKPT